VSSVHLIIVDMTTPAIKVESLTKSFKLRLEKMGSIRELFLNTLMFWKWTPAQDFTALKDISFTVPRGQTLGIIGDNGAGKSTLLKLLLGITPPTSGLLQVNGKIAALLELGAGFHPDLTGRENIYLNGSILGISEKVLNERMEDIIEFAELRDFIDSPIKHYSSGMYVRLGFSIAIHTDPEVLLVDEVLAVGDGAFQAKCVDKIRRFQQEGKTIVIVSHDLGMIEKVSHRAILLNHGHIEKDGDAREVVKIYYERIMNRRMELARQFSDVQVIPTAKSGFRTGSREIEITEVHIFGGTGEEKYIFTPGEPLEIRIKYKAHQTIENPIFGIGWADENGHYLNGSNTRLRHEVVEKISTGEGELKVSYPQFNLQQGKYLLSCGIYREPIADETAYDYHACLYSIFMSLGKPGDEGVFHQEQTWEFQPPTSQ